VQSQQFKETKLMNDQTELDIADVQELDAEFAYHEWQRPAEEKASIQHELDAAFNSRPQPDQREHHGRDLGKGWSLAFPSGPGNLAHGSVQSPPLALIYKPLRDFIGYGPINANALADKTPNREPEDEPAAPMLMFCAMSLCFDRML
jgi:hypothetical protein